MYLTRNGSNLDAKDIIVTKLSEMGLGATGDWAHEVTLGDGIRFYASTKEMFVLLHTIEKALGMDAEGRSPEPMEIEAALKDAKDAHGEYEARTGEPDANWPAWYAKRMSAFFRKRQHEDAGVATWVEGRPGGALTGDLGPSPLNPEEPFSI